MPTHGPCMHNFASFSYISFHSSFKIGKKNVGPLLVISLSVSDAYACTVMYLQMSL